MHAPNGCCILKYLLMDIKEDVGIMFKIVSWTPVFSSSMAAPNQDTAYSGGTKNLLAVNHCDLEVTPSLSKCLQLHLSCLTRTMLAWVTNIWITGYAPLHTNPWMDFNRQANTDCIPCKCLHRMQQPQSVLFRNLNSRDAVHAVLWLLQM